MSFIFKLKAFSDGSIKEIINNTPLTMQNTGINAAGKFGKPCISFPGQRYQKIYTPTNILYGLNEFQISYWIKWSSPLPSRSGCYPFIIEPSLSCAATVGSDQPSFRMTEAYRNSNGSWNETLLYVGNIVYHAGSENLATSILDPYLETWTHHTATLKNNTLKFYVNGKIFGSNCNVPQSSLDAFSSNKNLYTRLGAQAWNYESQDYCGIFQLDDFTVSDKVIFNGEFTPPSSYLSDSFNGYSDKIQDLYGYK